MIHLLFIWYLSTLSAFCISFLIIDDDSVPSECVFLLVNNSECWNNAHRERNNYTDWCTTVKHGHELLGFSPSLGGNIFADTKVCRGSNVCVLLWSRSSVAITAYLSGLIDGKNRENSRCTDIRFQLGKLLREFKTEIFLEDSSITESGAERNCCCIGNGMHYVFDPEANHSTTSGDYAYEAGRQDSKMVDGLRIFDLTCADCRNACELLSIYQRSSIFPFLATQPRQVVRNATLLRCTSYSLDHFRRGQNIRTWSDCGLIDGKPVQNLHSSSVCGHIVGVVSTNGPEGKSAPLLGLDLQSGSIGIQKRVFNVIDIDEVGKNSTTSLILTTQTGRSLRNHMRSETATSFSPIGGLQGADEEATTVLSGSDLSQQLDVITFQIPNAKAMQTNYYFGLHSSDMQPSSGATYYDHTLVSTPLITLVTPNVIYFSEARNVTVEISGYNFQLDSICTIQLLDGKCIDVPTVFISGSKLICYVYIDRVTDLALSVGSTFQNYLSPQSVLINAVAAFDLSVVNPSSRIAHFDTTIVLQRLPVSTGNSESILCVLNGYQQYRPSSVTYDRVFCNLCNRPVEQSFELALSLSNNVLVSAGQFELVPKPHLSHYKVSERNGDSVFEIFGSHFRNSSSLKCRVSDHISTTTIFVTENHIQCTFASSRSLILTHESLLVEVSVNGDAFTSRRNDQDMLPETTSVVITPLNAVSSTGATIISLEVHGIPPFYSYSCSFSDGQYTSPASYKSNMLLQCQAPIISAPGISNISLLVIGFPKFVPTTQMFYFTEVPLITRIFPDTGIMTRETLIAVVLKSSITFYKDLTVCRFVSTTTNTTVIKVAKLISENVAHCWAPLSYHEDAFLVQFSYNQQEFSAPTNKSVFTCMHAPRIFDAYPLVAFVMGNTRIIFNASGADEKFHTVCKFGNTSVLATIIASTKFSCIAPTYLGKMAKMSQDVPLTIWINGLQLLGISWKFTYVQLPRVIKSTPEMVPVATDFIVNFFVLFDITYWVNVFGPLICQFEGFERNATVDVRSHFSIIMCDKIKSPSQARVIFTRAKFTSSDIQISLHELVVYSPPRVSNVLPKYIAKYQTDFDLNVHGSKFFNDSSLFCRLSGSNVIRTSATFVSARMILCHVRNITLLDTTYNVGFSQDGIHFYSSDNCMIYILAFDDTKQLGDSMDLDFLSDQALLSSTNHRYHMTQAFLKLMPLVCISSKNNTANPLKDQTGSLPSFQLLSLQCSVKQLVLALLRFQTFALSQGKLLCKEMSCEDYQYSPNENRTNNTLGVCMSRVSFLKRMNLVPSMLCEWERYHFYHHGFRSCVRMMNGSDAGRWRSTNTEISNHFPYMVSFPFESVSAECVPLSAFAQSYNLMSGNNISLQRLLQSQPLVPPTQQTIFDLQASWTEQERQQVFIHENVTRPRKNEAFIPTIESIFPVAMHHVEISTTYVGTITITGHNFYKGTAFRCFFGHTHESKSCVVSSDAYAACTVPNNLQIGSYKVSVSNDALVVSQETIWFCVFPPLVISSVEPNALLQGSYVSLKIHLAILDPNHSVCSLREAQYFCHTKSVSTFCHIPAKMVTSNIIMCPLSHCDVNISTPTMDVEVYQDDHRVSANAISVLLIPPIKISQLYPDRGFSQGGTEVTLVVDSDLQWELYTNISCIFGNQSTSATIHKSKLIRCTSPPSPPCSSRVILSLDELAPHQPLFFFEYVPTPSLTGIYPSFGFIEVESLIYITGSGFRSLVDHHSHCMVGSVYAKALILKDHLLSVRLAPHRTSRTGDVVVSCILAGGLILKSRDYFEFLSMPLAFSLKPNRGYAIATNTITIYGRGFRSNKGSSGLVCMFDDYTTNVTRIESTLISCEAPPSASAGEVNVSLGVAYKGPNGLVQVVRAATTTSLVYEYRGNESLYLSYYFMSAIVLMFSFSNRRGHKPARWT